jgi:ATP-binding cassette, subfamily B, bacterial PglK
MNGHRKSQLIYLFILISLTAVMEVISIGAVIPFLSILVDASNFSQSRFAKELISILNIQNQTSLILPITVSYVLAILDSSSSGRAQEFLMVSGLISVIPSTEKHFIKTT